MTKKKVELIQNICNRTGRAFDVVAKDMEELVQNSKKGTKNEIEQIGKLRESVNAYIHLHQI